MLNISVTLDWKRQINRHHSEDNNAFHVSLVFSTNAMSFQTKTGGGNILYFFNKLDSFDLVAQLGTRDAH